MPAKKRFKTKYPGVYFIKSKAVGSNKTEKIYYIVYRKEGNLIEEKAGRQFQDDMTPARAQEYPIFPLMVSLSLYIDLITSILLAANIVQN